MGSSLENSLLFISSLENLTNIKADQIDINNPELLTIFYNDNLLSKKHRTDFFIPSLLCISEFWTDYVRKIIAETKPNSFDDLVKVISLAHGANTWEQNGGLLVKSGATLNDLFTNWEDVIDILSKRYSVAKATAYKISEDVRKGKGLSEENTNKLIERSVPKYVIDSLNKIKYLYSRSKSVEHTINALREVYYKIHYPLEFYSTYFNLFAKQFELKTMQSGLDADIDLINVLLCKRDSKNNMLSGKEEELLKTLFVVSEMEQRGYKILNIDLYKSDATLFTIDYSQGGLIPPLIAVDGIGEERAKMIVKKIKEKVDN